MESRGGSLHVGGSKLRRMKNLTEIWRLQEEDSNSEDASKLESERSSRDASLDLLLRNGQRHGNGA